MRQSAVVQLEHRVRARLHEAAPAPIIAPGDNCWRVPLARRVAMLADGADYFRHLEDALRCARRSILILGWDFDGRIRLRADDPDSPELGSLLRTLVEARPELEVRILVWSLALIHAPGASWPLLRGAPWMRHPRIRLRLDRCHPLYASHHQKMVCIDDRVAFAGGIDLTVMRWDDCRHAADGAGRVTPDGKTYAPVHDVQMAVDGDAARALGDLARERWHRATGEALVPPDVAGDAWPAALAPDLADVPVAIARTAPKWRGEQGAGECALLSATAISAARRSIYIETQYLTAASLGDLLGEALARRDGPEVLIVVTLASSGWLEQFSMGHNRDRLVRRLMRADRHGRLRVFFPVVPNGSGDCPVLVHSKVLVVDDRFLRVGSSNFNNRSIGVDTECDLALDAAYGADRAAIAAVRDRLLAEHLGVTPAALARAHAEHGSLMRAVDALNDNGRGLRPYGIAADGPVRPVIGTGLLDPVRPLTPLWFLTPRG